jgi:tetratricopeptide (TPR) repeat protein
MERVKKLREQQWHALAGQLLQNMVSSKQQAMDLMGHASPQVRKVAIEVLDYHWQSRECAFAKECEKLAVHDEDNLVRQSAVLALGSIFKNSDDVSIGGLLANIVRDHQATLHVRRAAYGSLVLVRKGDSAFLGYDPNFSLEDVDWPFVQESANMRRLPVPVHPLAAYLAHLSESQALAYRIYEQGIEAFDRGEYGDAFQELSEAIRLWPESGAAYIARARASIEMGRLDDAITDLSHVIERRRDMIEPLHVRARAYRLQRCDALADQDERAALDLERESANRNAGAV